MKLELAVVSDAENIGKLLNLAYRGGRGWTTEHRLVDGDRSDPEGVKALINGKQSNFLILRKSDQLIACICLEKQGDEIYIGSFAVNPDDQSKGLGRRVLREAEKYATTHYKFSAFVMVVLSPRIELITFYERCGYKRCSIISQYPIHLGIGTPKINSLTIEQLRKSYKAR